SSRPPIITSRRSRASTSSTQSRSPSLERVVRVEDAGVVKQDIEAAEGLDGFADGAFAFGGSADIGAEENGFATSLEDGGGDGVAAFLVASGDGDLCTFSREEQGGRFANARGSSGDEGDLSF